MSNQFDATQFTGPVTFAGGGSLSPPAPSDPAHAARKAEVDAAIAAAQPANAELSKAGVLGADIASAATLNLEAATGESVNVTGTTGVTAITLSAGHLRLTKFSASLILTNSASLILLTGANVATAAGDIATWLGYAGGVVRMIGYQRASGVALADAGGTVTSVGLTMPSGFTVGSTPVTGAGTLAVTTALTGVLKGNGSGFLAAVAGTDYLAPAAIGTTVQGYDATLALLAGKTITGTGNIVLKDYVDGLVTGLLDLKGGLDCSLSPNYPTALKGDAYRVTVAGKIGGGSGKVVSVGDMIIAFADNAGGTEGTVGASWNVSEGNIPGITSIGTTIVTAANAQAVRVAINCEASPAVFADETERLATVPLKVGQLGFQIDTRTFYWANGLTDADWNSTVAFGQMTGQNLTLGLPGVTGGDLSLIGGTDGAIHLHVQDSPGTSTWDLSGAANSFAINVGSATLAVDSTTGLSINGLTYGIPASYAGSGANTNITSLTGLVQKSFAVTSVGVSSGANSVVVGCAGHNFAAGDKIIFSGLDGPGGAGTGDGSTANWSLNSYPPYLTVSATGLSAGVSFRIAENVTAIAQSGLTRARVSLLNSSAQTILTDIDCYGSSRGILYRKVDATIHDIGHGEVWEATDDSWNGSSYGIHRNWVYGSQGGGWQYGPAWSVYDGSTVGSGTRRMYVSAALALFNSTVTKFQQLGNGILRLTGGDGTLASSGALTAADGVVPSIQTQFNFAGVNSFKMDFAEGAIFWPQTLVGGAGGATYRTGVCQINTGTGAGSSLKLRASTYTNYGCTANGTDGNKIAWNKPMMVLCRFHSSDYGSLSANSIFRVTLGRAVAAVDVVDLDKKGIGFTVEGTALKFQSWDTSLHKTASQATLASLNVYVVAVISDGAGAIYGYLNGALIYTGTGGPTTLSGTQENQLSWEVTNGADSSNNGVTVNSLMVQWSNS